MLIASQPKKRQSFLTNQVRQERLGVAGLWRLVCEYGHRFTDLYVPGTLWRRLKLKGVAGPEKWCQIMALFVQYGRRPCIAE